MGIFLITGVLLILLFTFMLLKKVIDLKLISIISFLILIVVIVFYVLIFVNSQSISLKNESLGSFKIGEEIDKHNLKKDDRFSSNYEVVYSKKGDGDFLVTSNTNHQIISITNQSQDERIETSKGIKINDTFQNVIKTYGEEYKELWFVEGYETGIQYQDKDEQLLLEFYFNENKLYRIEFFKK